MIDTNYLFFPDVFRIMDNDVSALCVGYSHIVCNLLRKHISVHFLLDILIFVELFSVVLLKINLLTYLLTYYLCFEFKYE